MLKNFYSKIFTLTSIKKIFSLFIIGLLLRISISDLFNINIILDNIRTILLSPFVLFIFFIEQYFNQIDFKYLHSYIYKLISSNPKISFSYFTGRNNEPGNLDLSFFNKCKRKLYWHLVEKNNKSPLESWERLRYNIYLNNWTPDKKLLRDFLSSKKMSLRNKINVINWILNRRNPNN